MAASEAQRSFLGERLSITDPPDPSLPQPALPPRSLPFVTSGSGVACSAGSPRLGIRSSWSAVVRPTLERPCSFGSAIGSSLVGLIGLVGARVDAVHPILSVLAQLLVADLVRVGERLVVGEALDQVRAVLVAEVDPFVAVTVGVVLRAHRVASPGVGPHSRHRPSNRGRVDPLPEPS